MPRIGWRESPKATRGVSLRGVAGRATFHIHEECAQACSDDVGRFG
jgi:hypothetical protein